MTVKDFIKMGTGVFHVIINNRMMHLFEGSSVNIPVELLDRRVISFDVQDGTLVIRTFLL